MEGRGLRGTGTVEKGKRPAAGAEGVRSPTVEVEETFTALRGRLLELMRRGVESPLSDRAFGDLALEVFRFQCRAVPAYGRFVARRGVDPEAVQRWEDIPFLPTRAFKVAPLMVGDPRHAEAVFRTSGTTSGLERRGEHYVRDLSLYRHSLLPNFQAHMFPEGEGMPVHSLLPSPLEAPDSSLSYMMGEVLRELAGGQGGFYWDPRRGKVREGFLEALRGAEAAGRPVLVVGTAFAFVWWLEEALGSDKVVSLPPGSRILETGGYKGRSRALSREELYRGLEAAFGVPPCRVVNEYGMTEMLSQFYEPVLRTAEEREGPLSARYHRPPPWVRTLVLEPSTLKPLPAGEVGVLAHMDLANLGSVSGLLTEDLGRAVSGGFQLLGRSPGAEPRGCSLAMEAFLEAEGHRRRSSPGGGSAR